MQRLQHTLCFAGREGELLLGMKRRGFGAGKWNGFGGKVQEGEAIEASARREVREECGITILALEKRGVLDFVYGEAMIHEVHIFNVTDFSGVPTETEEMTPNWFRYEDIPFSKMWPDDPYWLPLFLAGRMFTGEFTFDSDKNLVSHTVRESSAL